MFKLADKSADYSDFIRIVFLGKTGNGKSSSINNLVGQNIFVSKASSKSVTFSCQALKGEILNQKCLIVDTPGLYDTERPQNEIFDELKNVMEFTYPGVNAFVIVISLARFTEEEQKTVESFSNYFGKDLSNFGVILFTRLDDLEEHNISLDDYIAENPKLNNYLNSFGRRYIGLNNRLDMHGERMMDLRAKFIEKIRLTIFNNNGAYYTTKLFESSQKAFELKLQKIKEMNMTLEEKNRQIEQINSQHQKALIDLQSQNKSMLEKMMMSINQKDQQIQEINRKHEESLKEMQTKTESALIELKESIDDKNNEIYELSNTIERLSEENKDLMRRQQEFAYLIGENGKSKMCIVL